MLFFFYGEKSFAAPSNFYFMKYGLKWLFKCKRLPTLDLSEKDYLSGALNVKFLYVWETASEIIIHCEDSKMRSIKL